MAKSKSALSSIGTRVHKLREKADMTQSELAKRMSVSRETLNHWENDAREIKATQVLKLAEIFNVTCDYILGGVSTGNVDLHRQLGLKDEALTQLKEVASEHSQGLVPPPLLKSELFNHMLSSKDFMASYPDRLLAYCNGRLDDDKDADRIGKPVRSEDTDLADLRLIRLVQELADSFYTDFYKPYYKANTGKHKPHDKNIERSDLDGDN